MWHRTVCLFLLYVIIAASENVRMCSTSGIVKTTSTSWSNWYSRVIGPTMRRSFSGYTESIWEELNFKTEDTTVKFHPIRKTPLSAFHFRLFSLSFFFSLFLPLSFSLALSSSVSLSLSLHSILNWKPSWKPVHVILETTYRLFSVERVVVRCDTYNRQCALLGVACMLFRARRKSKREQIRI